MLLFRVITAIFFLIFSSIGMANDSITLTQQEKAYLQQKKQIDLCIDPHWFPFEYNNEGKHAGMSGDIFTKFQQKLPIPFHLVQADTWVESIDIMKRGECDVFPLVMATSERETYLNFTQSYLNIPLVIATQKDVPFVQNLHVLKGKTVAIVKGCAFIELFYYNYPHINVIEVDTVWDGLSLVSKGKIFGYVDALPSIIYRLQEYRMDNIKISGSFDETWDLGVAVRKDDPVLLAIFEKLVASVTPLERQEIMDRYVSITHDAYTDYSLIYKVMLGFAIILAGLLLWNHRTAKKKQVLDRLYAELKEKDDKLELAYQELEKISTTDKLTNICNRRAIDIALIDELERCERNNVSFSLILLDIDHFKQVNDTFGHQVGDVFLTQFCALIKENIRKVDVFGRWGGEEFLIISPDSSDETPYIRAERIRHVIERKYFSQVGHRTASFGVTVYQRDDTMDTMLQRVDTAMYRAKESGRNRVVEINAESSISAE